MKTISVAFAVKRCLRQKVRQPSTLSPVLEAYVVSYLHRTICYHTGHYLCDRQSLPTVLAGTQKSSTIKPATNHGLVEF